MVVVINSNFINDFNLGDNIVYNLEILGYIYTNLDANDKKDQHLLYKPAIVWIASIMEAVLFDFHKRAQHNTSEGVRGLPTKVLDYMRQKHLDELGNLIASSKKHDLFGVNDSELYCDMDKLRKLRNRIHIQNSKSDLDRKDSDTFTQERLSTAEEILENVMKKMSKKYGRDAKYKYVSDFILPWREHFPETSKA